MKAKDLVQKAQGTAYKPKLKRSVTARSGEVMCCVCSCYFSPNNPFEVFETQILLLEESLSEAVGRTLIGRDFNNSRSPEWGEARLEWRGILVGEMVARSS